LRLLLHESILKYIKTQKLPPKLDKLKEYLIYQRGVVEKKQDNHMLNLFINAYRSLCHLQLGHFTLTNTFNEEISVLAVDQAMNMYNELSSKNKKMLKDQAKQFQKLKDITFLQNTMNKSRMYFIEDKNYRRKNN